jgi:apolipoprotein D and lipocalin family protein
VPVVSRRIVAALSITIALGGAGPRKSAPEPAKAIDLTKVTGRWYEIARTPNPNQKDCHGATTDWNAKGPGAYEVVQTCHKGAADGKARVMRAAAVPIDPDRHAKWKLSFFGGVIKQEYWLVDRADDHSWMLFGTNGGNYVWILSRRAQMPPAAKAEAVQRCRELGYDVGRLVFL